MVDLGVFNALRLGALGQNHSVHGPVGATIISVGIATLVTWFGNRYWTFRARRRSNIALELGEFVVVSVLGLLVSLACLWVSHYALGFESLLVVESPSASHFVGTEHAVRTYKTVPED